MTDDVRPDEEAEDEAEFEEEGNNGLLRSFGRQVKLFRERAGMSQPDVASRLGYSVSQVASIEQGRRIMQPDVIDRADEVLDAGGVLVAMKEQVERAGFPKFFQNARRYEGRAIELHAYDSQVINGLLQTEEYARAVLRMERPQVDDDVIEQRVASRIARQKIFAKKPRPNMSFVMEEALLRRSLGNPEMLWGELEHLLLVGQQRNVEIQVMPMDCVDHAGLNGPFKLMETDKQRIAYAEVQAISRLFTERKHVRELELKYGIIRAQALSPSASLAFIEKLLGER